MQEKQYITDDEYRLLCSALERERKVCRGRKQAAGSSYGPHWPKDPCDPIQQRSGKIPILLHKNGIGGTKSGRSNYNSVLHSTGRRHRLSSWILHRLGEQEQERIMSMYGEDQMNDSFNAEGYNNLAYAVVEQAAVDYMKALRRLSSHPDDLNALHAKNDCESFFENEISIYSDIDGKWIMQTIRNRVCSENSKKYYKKRS